MEICPAITSKYNSTHKREIILLIIPNVKKEDWYYVAVKKVSALLHGVTSRLLFWIKIFYENVCKKIFAELEYHPESII